MIPLLHTPTRPPRAHQWEALRRAKGAAAFAYFLEMGTGKSKVLVDEMIEMWLEDRIEQVLILAGAGSYEEWVSKHLPENVPPDMEVVSHLWRGGKTKREKDALSILPNSPGLRVLVMNTEAIGSSKPAFTVATNFVRSAPTLVAVDESTMIKTHTAQRSRAAFQLGNAAKVRRILTGSPVTNSPMDLWGQLVFLGVSGQFGQNYYNFRARYCELKDVYVSQNRTVKKIVGYRNLDVLEHQLSKVSYRVLKEDCLDLPPKIYEQCAVELTDEQEAIYHDMSKLAMAQIRDGVWATSKNTMGQLMRMHQIVLGHIMDDDGVMRGIPTRRPHVLGDLLEETSGKVIIWCNYRRDVDLVLDELERRFLGRRAVRYDGAVSDVDRPRLRDEFQSGEAEFFVGTPATGGRGLTLTAASTVVYYSNGYNLEHRLQSEDRNHRDGQTKSVTYVDMIAPGTIEERILSLLKEKRSLAEAVVGDDPKQWMQWFSGGKDD